MTDFVMPGHRITIDSQTCSGCGDCAQACVEQLRRRTPDSYNLQSRVKILGAGPRFWLSICRHCEQAPCADACISGAVVQNRQARLVELEEQVCIGCTMCVMVCPFGSIWLDAERGKSFKCDGCPASDIPPCVAACKPGALRLDAVSCVASEHRRRTTESVVTPDRRIHAGHWASTAEGADQ